MQMLLKSGTERLAVYLKYKGFVSLKAKFSGNK